MVDRDAVLARVDLYQLADEVLGPGRGRGRSRTWPCPAPDHAQSGRTPPLSVFTARSGEQRFRCHGCGLGGTAVDLVMISQRLDVHGALEVLASRASLTPMEPTRKIAAEPLAPAWGMTSYLRRCAALLDREEGGPARRWLTERNISERVRKELGLGFDPGPGELPRMRGLPRSGPSVTVPLPLPGRSFMVARYLEPDAAGLRWAHPMARHWGPSPAAVPLGAIRRGAEAIVLTEGVSDGLAALAARMPAVVVLGAARDPDSVARVVRRWYPAAEVLIAGDGDEAGRRFATGMRRALRNARVLEVPPGRDLGDLVREDRVGASRWLRRGRSAVRDRSLSL